MDLEINRIENQGGTGKERVVMFVLRSCNTDGYILFDTTYTEAGEVSNELRHAYLFPSVDVGAGDWIRLFTKKGTNRGWESPSGLIYHDFYWGLDEPVWNDEGDCAFLVKVTACSSKCVGDGSS